MKTAKVIHREIVTTIVKDGVEIDNATPEQKIMASIFGDARQHVFETELAVIRYKNLKELDTKFQEVVKEFSGLVPEVDMYLLSQ